MAESTGTLDVVVMAFKSARVRFFVFFCGSATTASPPTENSSTDPSCCFRTRADRRDGREASRGA
eukprot:CAMPEP_0194037696 /NCGR_PEP_ID=MMETSP0009_2-20130614/10027_1 /TAXON_ID=210454 /ORGANISM="Grammatophora oceanica, Strain CCMP 410" /LENGTH=64 /DNA_ID=CAMNT_0038679951 /DNA_START=146 /DNA_END=336 /DNA_ORIENTATION=+